MLITGISSMATRAVLAELTAAYEQRSGRRVAMESVGGVDAARRVQTGESFDAVVLASEAIDKLIKSGHMVAGSRVDLVRSGVAVAVQAGSATPDIASEDAVRQAVLKAPSIGYSTGPSGVALAKLFERWGIVGEIEHRIVQAPPGVPVGVLIARGDVSLGFQQLSELMNVEGVTVVGPLPNAVQIMTIFSGGIASTSRQPEAVQGLLRYMASPDTAEVKRRHGMDPA